MRSLLIAFILLIHQNTITHIVLLKYPLRLVKKRHVADIGEEAKTVHTVRSVPPSMALSPFVRAFAQRKVSGVIETQSMPAFLETVIHFEFGDVLTIRSAGGVLERGRPLAVVGPYVSGWSGTTVTEQVGRPTCWLWRLRFAGTAQGNGNRDTSPFRKGIRPQDKPRKRSADEDNRPLLQLVRRGDAPLICVRGEWTIYGPSCGKRPVLMGGSHRAARR